MPKAYARDVIAAHLSAHGYELLGEYKTRRTPTLIRCLKHGEQQIAISEDLALGTQKMPCCRKGLKI